MIFDEDHKLWQWMTFYWEPEDNGRGWAPPWNHFHMKTTSTSTEGGTLRPFPQIANPYLEGVTDGMSTNCVSCHSLAVYSAKGDRKGAASQLVQAAKAPYGDLKTSGYPASEKLARDCGYFQRTVRTHFIWSLASVGGMKPDSGLQNCPEP